MPPQTPPDDTPSTLWMWGFWVYTGLAIGSFLLSLSAPSPGYGVFRVAAGVLLFAGGVHQLRVVRHKRATRRPYSTFGPNAYMLDRQTGWSAMVLGVVLALSAAVGL